MNPPESQELLARYQTGDSAAAGEIFERYVRRLVNLAASRMAASLRRRVDPEDVVQSAYRSFFSHAQAGQYALARAGDLWRLLAAITLHKVQDQAARHTAAKRDFRREREPAEDDSAPVLRAREPTADEMLSAVEHLDAILARLGQPAREAVTMKLAGHDLGDIAAALGRSPRTARRLIDDARQELERSLPAPLKSALLSGGAYGPPPGGRIAPLPAATLAYADYALLALVGRGGMGKVYRARDKRSGNLVAIKALHKARQHDAIAVERFVSEARIVARLAHPAIVAVHGVGQFPGGGLFLALDYVEGRDLSRRLAAGPVDRREAARIAIAAAEAIEHAHEAGVVHCDLKPSNILLADDGRVLVTDFGFAQLLPAVTVGASRLLPPGGTPAFTPPEVRKRASFIVARPLDIYGLGVILAAMLTTEAASHGRPAKPATTAPGASLASIAKKCMAEDPSDRYPTAGELAAALRAAAH